ncbi:serine protease nudel isoform X1 [Eurosta solidaginis]|uniref:serine protease nudel isoform X1 n=1 Tax=Eurosta solidaginis TaxID=178769 RepID=UPI003530E1CE
MTADNDIQRTRSQRKCFKTVLTRILAVLGLLLVVIMMALIYYAIALDRIEKLHKLKILSSQHEKHQNGKHSHSNHISSNIELETATGPISNNDAIESLKDYDPSLDVQHLRARILHHRQARFVPDMLDPIFLQREPDFDSLYAKVRNKRTRLELSKLEKEYFRCKKESINSSGCMAAFAQLYSLAKEISEKMDKMKDIFNENEEALEQSGGSVSHDSKENVKDKTQNKDEKSTKNKKKNEEVIVSSTTETSFNADLQKGDDGKNHSSTNNEDKHIYYSWIIDGPDYGVPMKDASKENKEKTVSSIKPESTIVPATISTTSIVPNGTDSMSEATSYRPTNVSLVVVSETSVDFQQTGTEKNHNDTANLDTDNESHKISWILDGFENDQEVRPADRPLTTAKPLETEFRSEAAQKSKTTIDDKPEKISWIIDGQHDDDAKPEMKLKSTTETILVKELTTKIAEEITWILDENENEDELVTEATAKPTKEPTENKPDRISWIIDGHDDSEDKAATTQKNSATFTQDIFQELKLVTESVDVDEDKLRKLKYDTIAGEGVPAASVLADFERIEYTTIDPDILSTHTLVMNRTVTLSNFTSVTITYGRDCATTPPQPTASKLDELNEQSVLQGKGSKHPLDSPTSLEYMLESAERQLQPKTNKEVSVTLDTKNTSVPSAYDPQIWEELFRKSSLVQQDELIDTFDAADVQEMMKNGAKLNSANIDSFQDMQFMSLCEQVAKRLRNRGGYRNSTNVTPPPSSHFTSRGPGGFPVTGETMKATAQFLYNPNFGMPTIPICFYLTPANFRMVNQSPMWGQGFQSFQGMQNNFMNTQMGMNMNNGVFFVPQQSFGPTAGFFAQTGATGGGGNQGNMANVFSKNASPQKQQQQFFCTYMQNNANSNKMSSTSGMGSGGGAMNAMSFSNANFKMRTSAQNLSTDIIYASYTSIPDHLGHADHYDCESPEEIGCYSGKECIRKSSWCDNLVDCHDGSDESACRCIDRLTNNRICDGYADCPMGEDELGCFGCTDASYSCYDGPEKYAQFHRSTVSMCYSAIEKCDGIMNCLNGRDELECNIIVKDVKDHMSHAVSSSSGFLFHNYRGDWYPVCNNAEKWAYEACENEADQSTKPIVSFREITLTGPFIEPTIVGQAHFPQSCQQRNAGDKLKDQAAFVDCAPTACGRVKKRKKSPFRQKRSRALSDSVKLKKDRLKREVSDERIVGGSYSAPMQWPFVVGIYRDGKFHCGGTIYTENWILSAAHCVINYHKYYYEIRAGTLRRSSFESSAQIRSITNVVVHQAYERRSMRNDLSLLRMNEPLMFNRWVKPICLPDMGRSTAGNDWIWGPEENTLCTAVGWGAVREKGPGSDQLREVVVPIRKQCIELDDKMSENVCAGDISGGRDACQGDSGGPLFCRSVNNTDEWYLAGIVSHGNGCARPGEVGAYTRVSLYLDWIEMAMKYSGKIKPRILCPGYTCVWGGKRCIAMKKRCDRVVDCLGGEDEVGCFYNFIPDMVGSSFNMTTTTESDYYPENVVTSPPCKLSDKGHEVRERVEDEEKKEDGEKAKIMVTTIANETETETEFQTSATKISSTDATTTTQMNTMAYSLPETLSTEEVTTDGSTTKENITEFDTTERSTIKSSTVQTVMNNTESSTLDTNTSMTTQTTASSTVPTTTEITSDSPSTILADNTAIYTTEEISTSESSTTEITTEGPSSSATNTKSQTPFDVQNLVTTTMKDFVMSSTINSVSSQVPEIARTEATTIATVSVKQPKFNTSTIPGKFVCQRIPQIVEQTNRCDRILDCEDGTDEEACSCRDFLKGTLNILICDGKSDCEDLTDEENCDNCRSSEFLCPLSKTCVSLKKRCDGIIDCDFKEDEKDCFALTNGREIVLDADKRPTLNSAGIFSRNSHGKWLVVCTHEIPLVEQIANTASSVCTQLGFKSLKFYNITHFITHDTIVPIHPDFHKPKSIHSHFSSIAADNHNFPNFRNEFRPNDLNNKARTLHIERTSNECSGLFVECEAKANNVEPIKTISAGDQISSDGVSSSGLRPALETYGKPNVYVTPPTSSMILMNKKDEILEKMEKVIESRKNISLMIDNKLHEAVEEMHWPWIVDVYVDGQLWCVGALVDRYWVLVHESCQFGVRFHINYIAVLLGGGKSKHLRHKSTHEQIRRVDCFERVPKSDVLLYHLEKPTHFTHHVLPTFLPDFSARLSEEGKQCIAILHDDNSGRIKTVTAIDERNDALCKSSDMSCYRLVERKPPKDLIDELGVSDEDFINLSDEVTLREALDDNDGDGIDALGKAISRFTTCTQFGKKNISRTALEPVDQGILACRETNTGWYPMALFDYNNTNCDSFKDALALRSLEKVYGTIQNIIDKPKCEQPNGVPVCKSFRCLLGECLDDAKICDGISDCHDGADEERQLCIGRKKVCQPSELKCRTSYKCVPKTKFCDHIADCDDMTDEPTLCSCYTYLQATDPKKICDGIRNCWDKSDESPALCNCTANHFRCGKSVNECVPRDFVCDKEPDCPNGEDERYCYGIEFPQQEVTGKADFKHIAPIHPKQSQQYGQVIEQTYGVWHTKCFPRKSPPDVREVRKICKQLGYSPYKQPSYRVIDDAAMAVVETNEWPDQRGRSFGREEESPLKGRYRSATKAVVVSKFSPLSLNEELTLFLKPSRPIAEVAQWNRTDSENCYRLEIKCM